MDLRKTHTVWLYTEGKHYLAHALEIDYVAQGRDGIEALSNLKDGIKCIRTFRQGEKRWSGGPAPKEYWKNSKRSGALLRGVRI